MQTPVDISNCAREPIHIPGAIQPHGILFALAEPSLQILQVSRNIENLLGRPAETFCATDFGLYVADEDLVRLKSALGRADLRPLNPHRIRLKKGQELLDFDAIVHRREQVLVLELEPKGPSETLSFVSFYHAVREATTDLQEADTFAAACESSVQKVKQLTGFDRVTIYQFDRDWNGVVVAEARSPDVDSYLGLRFPAGDIPAQARQLYKLNWLRLIADVNYQPAMLMPLENPLTQKPLDLSLSTLRSVSPIHLEYMRNMKTAASMSISIMKGGELWGLISCHHREPRYVDYQTRTVCEFIGQVFSQQISAIEGRQDYQQRQRLQALQQNVLQMVGDLGFPDGILHHAPRFLELVDAEGGVVLMRDRFEKLGLTPDAEQIHELIQWLKGAMQGHLFVSDHLARDFPPAAAYKDRASGLLALSISKSHESLLLWFRPEIIQTVSWAGNPDKSVQGLHPRQSFDLWKETVSLTSKPWAAFEIDAAQQFRSGIIAEELARVNAELKRSNDELDSFAYIASHDLKEPLRGIGHYVNFVLEDNEANLDETSKKRLRTVDVLCHKIEDLVGSLYHYSRVGRMAPAIDDTDLNLVVEEVLIRLRPFIEEHNARVEQIGSLPTLRCDRVRIGEVFYNLIHNAIKYNNKKERRVVIGFLDEAFFVSDNGIGIPDKHHAVIFSMWKRLHDKNAYGGGTGSGLAIVKRIVEMHRGRVWVESHPEEGSTFYFTLALTQDSAPVS